MTKVKVMNPENKIKPAKQPFNRLTNKLLNHLTNAIFYLAILFFAIGFNFSDRMAGNWYQQWMPDLGGRTIVDMTFTDSLTGYAITSRLSVNDYPKILKTSNSGNNWNIIYNNSDTSLFTCLYFLNQNTGYVGGFIEDNFNFSMLKTTNGGVNWNSVNTPFDTYQDDIHALNEDSIWFAMSSSSSGGVYFTSNGGVNWIQQYSSLSNPDRIYMYNAKLGFIGYSTSGSNFRRTTNSGASWDFLSNSEGLIDIFFTDSLTGWKSGFGGFKKTINGGLNWVIQTLPSGGYISTGSGILTFSNINKDTAWGVGGYLFYPIQGARAFLYRTTNGGDTWYFQIPDTSYQIPNFSFTEFTNRYNGWAYTQTTRGIHTTNGGDTTFYLPVNQISSEVPSEYKLFQNYPNPFNPNTIIRFQINRLSDIKLSVFDIQGKQIAELVNGKYSAGIYETDWNAAGFASGIYFYSLIIDNNLIDSKKMILLK
ncbi:MAG: hemagluttinin repeat-containing protein [Chlorobi bacterium OLB5]|nr:MAG: hemagluttinin repeat-containing protein [Chlorobi bacterium OLB5]